jgi:hypothetical protein
MMHNNGRSTFSGLRNEPLPHSCMQTAYAAESLTCQDRTYHKTCFKCSECGTRLTLTTFKVRWGSLCSVDQSCFLLLKIFSCFIP